MQGYPLLASLKNTDEIRALSYSRKAELALEIRRLILETVSRNGGHLAPNLGVVELTIALLSTFSPPEDTIVFDVGHQCYTWKILTGRFGSFPTLRLRDGISGFPKRDESPYDAFNTGHSSTSVSACAGIARAKRLKGDFSRTMAVIGDGAIESGMAFEALSDLGQRDDNVIVILNDNQMCIDHVVGGMARHMEQLRTSTRYLQLKPVWERRMNAIPGIGRPLVRGLARLKRHWRSYRRESGILFEQLGFRYYGPVDGHDQRELERHLAAVRLVRGPVLLHVVTEKGKGYPPAEQNPENYHGVSSFDPERGIEPKTAAEPETFSDIFGKTMIELAQKDRSIVSVVAAMKQGTGLSAFSGMFPERFWDVGIAEEHAVTMAAGMAAFGLRPFVAIYSTFLQRSFDQLLHDVCLQNLPVVFAVDRAGVVGGDGATHQGLHDLAFAMTLPNMTVLAPATAPDLRRAMYWAAQHNGPVLIRFPKCEAPAADLEIISPEQHDADDPVTLRLVQSGKDLTVVALGPSVFEAAEACRRIRSSHPDYSIDLYSCLCALPFDYKSVIHSIQKTNALLLVEEGVEQGGFGSCIAGEICRMIPGCFVEYAGITNLTSGAASRIQLIRDGRLDAQGLQERMVRLIEART